MKQGIKINTESFLLVLKLHFKFKVYPLKIHSKNKNSNNLSSTIKYPSIFKLNITKVGIEAKKNNKCFNNKNYKN